jgi:hypothetical protein
MLMHLPRPLLRTIYTHRIPAATCPPGSSPKTALRAWLSAPSHPKYFDNQPVICNDNFVSVLIEFGTLAFRDKDLM